MSKTDLTKEMEKTLRCTLETLPESIESLTGLEVLNVIDSSSNSSKIRLSVLPELIGNLVNLMILDLRGNQLEEWRIFNEGLRS